MPPLPPVPNVMKFTIEGSTGLHPWTNVLHWTYTGGVPTDANCIAFSGVLFAAWSTDFAALMLAGSTITKATCVDLTSALGSSGETLGTVDGTRTGGTVPSSASVLIKKTISRRYRGGHPRTYIFAGADTDLDDSAHWAAGLTGAVFTAYTAVRTAMDLVTEGSTSLGTEVIVSYVDTVTNPVPPHRRTVPLIFPVGTFSVEALVATQRRRIGR
jgi:hypothetical protein